MPLIVVKEQGHLVSTMSDIYNSQRKLHLNTKTEEDEGKQKHN